MTVPQSVTDPGDPWLAHTSVNGSDPPLPLDAAVMRPLASTVTLAFVNDPTLLFTVASVFATAPALVVTSPVNAGILAAATVPDERLEAFRVVNPLPLPTI